MPFIGQNPSVGAYNILDNITIGSNTNGPFNLLLNGAAFTPESANHLLVSLNGVIQKPGSSFTVSGSQITFVTSSGTLTTSDSIDFIMVLGNVLNVGTPTDGAVSTNKIANDAVTGAKIAPTITTNHTFSGTNTFSGTTTVPAATSGWRHIKTQTGNNHSSVDFMHGVSGVVFDNTYDIYEFVIHYFYAVSHQELEVLPSTNGSTFTKVGTVGMVDGVYRASNANTDYNIDLGGGPNGGTGQPQNGFLRSIINVGAAKGEMTAGTMRVYYPHENQFTTLAVGQLGVVQEYDSGLGNKMSIQNSMGSTSVAGTTYGIQFKASSGNCYTKISLYGIKDS